MAKRNIEFEVGKYYHVFNRGVDKRNIFLDKGDLFYFFDAIILSQKEETLKNITKLEGRKKAKEIFKRLKKDDLVTIVAYCLLPNHFHFILKEKKEGGISKFMSKLGTSYVKFFNSEYERSGALFQGRYKAKEIENLEVVTAYVNLNYKHHKLDLKKDLVKTSLFEYIDKEKGERICDEKEIKKVLAEAGGLGKYKEYIKNHSIYFAENKGLKLNENSFDKDFE